MSRIAIRYPGMSQFSVRVWVGVGFGLRLGVGGLGHPRTFDGNPGLHYAFKILSVLHYNFRIINTLAGIMR